MFKIIRNAKSGYKYLIVLFVLHCVSANAWGSVLDKSNPTSKKQLNDEKIKNTAVDLDFFITHNKTDKKGKRMIYKPLLVDFTATIQTLPKKENTQYVINALRMMGMTPLPEIHYQMFIRSKQDKVIAVYVEDKLAETLLKHMKPEQQLKWSALHSYSYYRGPALVLTTFELIN